MGNRDRIVALALLGAGVWQCVAVGEAINADGISYLDLARQYASGNWSALSNGYWSPLYPLTVGLAFRALGWLGLSELTIAYAVNLVYLLLAAAGFASLLDALSIGPAGSSERRFGDTWSRGAAWALFAWLMIRLISVASITPDTFVAALLFYATAIIARRTQAALPGRQVVTLGVVLGVAYAAKTVMFPAAVVLLLAFAWVARAVRGPQGIARELSGALVAFAAIAIPLVAEQSRAAGHLSIGETGRLNYAWYVNSATPTIADAADRQRPPGSAVALASVAGARLYADSAPGSFPYWYDPARWSPGVEAGFDVAEQWQVLRVTGRWYRMVAGLPVMAVLLFFGLALEAKRRPRLELWPLLAAPIAMCSMYALVHVEGRLVGAALVTVLIVILAMADADDGKAQSRSREFVCAGIVAVGVVASVQRLIEGPRLGESRAASHVAAEMRRVGVQSGADVAVLGWPLDQGVFWAHVAQVQIVATIPVAPARGLTPDAMASLSAETCRLGRDIRAFVGRDSIWSRAASARDLGDGWFAWLPTPPPGRQSSACPRLSP